MAQPKTLLSAWLRSLSLLVRVQDKMTTDIPGVQETTLFKDLIYEVSNKRLGMTMVFNSEGNATGVITDGDIRRAVQHFDDLKKLKALDFMTRSFKSVAPQQLLTEALELMDASNITTLPVMTEGQVKGIISIHHIIDFK
jgi:arabinose-5-phosphate isomerase